jgi:hypothetical protein
MVVSGICFASSYVLSHYFLSHMPRNPQPEVQRIYPYYMNGVTVYLTWGEKVADLSMFCVTAATIVLAWIFGLISMSRDQTKRMRQKGTVTKTE